MLSNNLKFSEVALQQHLKQHMKQIPGTNLKLTQAEE